MKSKTILLLLLFAHSSLAQVFTIKTISVGDSYTFPVIESAERPAIAKKINLMIQKDLGADSKAKNPFDSVAGEDEYSFQTGAVNERVIALVVTGAHTGCGLHVTRNVYNLDSKTGAPIDLNKLFSADGKAKLFKALYKRWNAKLDAVRAIHDEQYTTCQEDLTEFADEDIYRFLIMDNGVQFFAGYCLDGSSSEYDVTVGPHDFSLGQLLPMLSPYGYSLFTKKPAAPLETLLRGTIDGKYPISMSLKEDSSPGNVIGTNVYDRVGEPILLSGTMTGNQFVLHELDDSKNPISNIEVSWDGTKLTGSFTNLKTKKQMSFVASAVK